MGTFSIDTCVPCIDTCVPCIDACVPCIDACVYYMKEGGEN